MKIIVNDRNPLMFSRDNLIKLLHFVGYDEVEFIKDYGSIPNKELAKKLLEVDDYYSQDPCEDDLSDRLANDLVVFHFDKDGLQDMVIKKVLQYMDQKGE